MYRNDSQNVLSQPTGLMAVPPITIFGLSAMFRGLDLRWPANLLLCLEYPAANWSVDCLYSQPCYLCSHSYHICWPLQQHLNACKQYCCWSNTNELSNTEAIESSTSTLLQCLNMITASKQFVSSQAIRRNATWCGQNFKISLEKFTLSCENMF